MKFSYFTPPYRFYMIDNKRYRANREFCFFMNTFIDV